MRILPRTMQSLLVGTVFAVSLVVVLPSIVYAQTGTAPKPEPGSGLCVKDSDCGPGGTCTYIPGEMGLPGVSGCSSVTNGANGSTVTNSNFTGVFGTTNASTTRDANGNIIAQTSATSESALGGGGGGTGCSVANAINPLTWGDCIMNAIAFFVLGFANFMLGIAGVLLNWVVVKTVFQFSTLVGNSAGLLIAWGILRDIGNLVLLFGFVLMGIGTILDTSKLPDKKAIPMLIIFAILLNFSIFAAEAVIDTSNVLTSVLYSQANTDPCTTETCTINNGIAGHIMQSTGLSGIYGLKPEDAGEGVKKFVVLMGLALFSLIGTVVLLATALMLAFRAIVLTGLIIVSPIGFAGMAIKPLEKMAKRWWNALIHQAFFAPILFLLLFVTLKVTEGFSSVSNNSKLADALTGTGTSNMGIIMVFVLISGGLIASLMAAKQFGAMGADIAVKTAGSFAFGTGSFIGRRTLGVGSYVGAEALRKTTFARSGIGRFAVGTLDKAATSSYDARAPISKGLKNAGVKGVPDLGAPSKVAQGGYKKIVDEEKKKKSAYAKTLGMTGAEEEEKKQIEENKKQEDTRWEKQKETMQVEVGQYQKDADTASEVRKQAITAQKKALDEATETLRKDPSLISAQLAQKTAQAKWESMVKEQADAAAETKKTVADKKIAISTGEKQHTDSLKVMDNNIQELRADVRFARGLEKNPISIFNADIHSNKAVAKEILKNVNKDQNQMLLDALSGVQQGLNNPPPAPAAPKS